MELHSWTICCLTGQIPTTLLPKRHNSERCRSAGTGPKSILTIIYIMIKLPFTYRKNCWNNTVDFILLRMWAYQLACTLYIAHWASTTHTSASQSHSKEKLTVSPFFDTLNHVNLSGDTHLGWSSWSPHSQLSAFGRSKHKNNYNLHHLHKNKTSKTGNTSSWTRGRTPGFKQCSGELTS